MTATLPTVAKRVPINFRPTAQDREAIAVIRAGVPWLKNDADAIRYGLAMGVDVLTEIGNVHRKAAERVARKR